MRVLSEFSCEQFIQLKPEFATPLSLSSKKCYQGAAAKVLTGAGKAKK